ncbi:MAG: peroxiredoxin family protein [Calditrichia bacterium]
MKMMSCILLIAALFLGCSEQHSTLEVGTWRALVKLPGGELPFTLDVREKGSSYAVTFINGDERVLVDSLRIDKDHLYLKLPAFNSTIEATIERRHRLTGFLTLIKRGGKKQVMSFVAMHGEGHRFSKEDVANPVDVSGRWAVTFREESGDSTLAVGVFEQDGKVVTGTFMTPTGDYRYLAGEVAANGSMQLSCFDGNHAFLFNAVLDENDMLSGNFWSGTQWHETWTAKRDADVSLPDAYRMTYLKDGYDRFDFTFPDTDSNSVSLTDEKYRDKVVVLTIAGSWCPNCHDEAAFMAPFHKRYREHGLEIVGLMYEHFRDFPTAAKQVERFRKKFKIEYDLLVAGYSDKADAAKTLPMINHVLSYPTTIFIDKKGNVRKIHTGFTGPGTGDAYETLTHEFTELVETLLAE